MKAPVFICYRREDSSASARLVRNALQTALSRECVFFDHDSIPPGEPWPSTLKDALEAAKVVVSVIGPKWLLASDEYGRRRLDEPNDWLRQELETALTRDLLLLPVLVGGLDKLPPAEAVPEPLRPLVLHQYLVLRDASWDHDVKLVVERVREKLGFASSADLRRGMYPTPPSTPPRLLSKAKIQQALAGELGGWTIAGDDGMDSDTDSPTELYREYRFGSFREAIDYMCQVAAGCDVANHHPRWENRDTLLRVFLCTWEAGHRITDRDLRLASYFDAAYSDSQGRRARECEQPGKPV